MCFFPGAEGVVVYYKSGLHDRAGSREKNNNPETGERVIPACRKAQVMRLGAWRAREKKSPRVGERRVPLPWTRPFSTASRVTRRSDLAARHPERLRNNEALCASPVPLGLNWLGAFPRVWKPMGSSLHPAVKQKNWRLSNNLHTHTHTHIETHSCSHTFIAVPVTHPQAVCPLCVLCECGRQYRWPSHHVTHLLLSSPYTTAPVIGAIFKLQTRHTVILPHASLITKKADEDIRELTFFLL